MITLYPRFIVKNNLGDDIRIRETGSTNELTLHNGDRHFLRFMRAGHEPQLVLAYTGSPTQWSADSDLGH